LLVFSSIGGKMISSKDDVAVFTAILGTAIGIGIGTTLIGSSFLVKGYKNDEETLS
jgi:hypothetical protein